MRIGLDLHTYDGLHQGSRTYMLELASRVARLAPELSFVAFLSETDRLRRERPDLETANLRLVPIPPGGPVRRLLLDVPRLAQAERLDLLHMQYVLPLVLPCPAVLTVHDLLFEDHPEWFGRLFRLRSRLLVPLSACRASHVLTGSEFSRRALVSRYRLHDSQVTVTPYGVDAVRFHPIPGDSETVRHRGLAPGGYLLTVGRLEPRKNHATLLEAWSRLGPSAPPLVVVGQRDFGYRDLLDRLSRQEVAGRVRVIEDVTDRELPELYRHAMAFAYPSHAEGFGLPPLEAMASGVPVVASNTSAIPEVVGEAGMLVPPSDVQAWTLALTRILFDAPTADRLRRLGMDRVRTFSWEQTAAATLAVYRRLIPAPSA